jgi:SAM-dependent methyltransferase
LEDYEPHLYGDRFADVYDEEDGAEAGDIEPVVDALAGLVSEGSRAFELGIGTGRIAIPLAQRGLRVEGIDISPRMLEQLRNKPSGDQIEATVGSFDDFDGGPYDLIYCVYNTFSFLTSLESQTSCFRSVGRALAPGGAFVIEEWTADLARFPDGQRLLGYGLASDRVKLDVMNFDLVDHTLDTVTVIIRSSGIELVPARQRLVMPSELDLMATIAGVELEDRWSDWDRSPYTLGYGSHVSIYRRPSNP